MTVGGSTRMGARAVRRHHVDRLLIALLCIFGVLALLLTMNSMGHPQPQPHVGISAPDQSTSAFASSHVRASPTEGAAGSLESVTAQASSDSAGDDLTCAILGVSCMLVLLALFVRTLLVRPTLCRAPRDSGAHVRLRLVRQRFSIRPSLIALSISRT